MFFFVEKTSDLTEHINYSYYISLAKIGRTQTYKMGGGRKVKFSLSSVETDSFSNISEITFEKNKSTSCRYQHSPVKSLLVGKNSESKREII